MAVVPLNETPIPGLAAGYLRHLQYDSVAIDLDDQEYSRLGPRLIELSSCEPETDKEGIDSEAIRDLFARPGSGTTATYRAILTIAQYRALIEYLCLDQFYYRSFGDLDKAEAVLAFSFGEKPDVNTAIAKGIIARFWSTPDSRFSVPVYAQWEIADVLQARLKRSSDSPNEGSLNLYPVGEDLDRRSPYLRTEEVVAKCHEVLSGKNIALACQAWHSPRSYRECNALALEVVAGLCIDLFSPRDRQFWVHDILAWVVKESASWRRRQKSGGLAEASALPEQRL